MNHTSRVSLATMVTIVLLAVQQSAPARADIVISTFDSDYFENLLFGSWTSATIEYGPDSYTLTATGYGSNWTYVGDKGIFGAGNNYVELDVTLAGPPEADGHLGPLVQFIDADGTHYHYRWYGQLLGNHVLSLPVESPSFVSNNGTVPGLDLDALAHMHLELDPGGFGTQGAYTVSWNELSLVTIEGVTGDFDGDGDVDGHDFLVWQRGGSTTPLSATDLADWQGAFGDGPLAAIAAIPEPSAICLMVLLSVSALGRLRPPRSMA